MVLSEFPNNFKVLLRFTDNGDQVCLKEF